MDQRLTEPHERIALPITERDTSTKVGFELDLPGSCY